MNARTFEGLRQGGLIAPSFDSAALGVGELGGKGFNLLKLSAMGFTVPPFWIISTSVLENALAMEKKRIAETIRGLGNGDPEVYDALERRIKDIVQALPIEQRLHRAIAAELELELDCGSLYAVRSSMVGEDSATDSYAGQMDSFLNVAPHEVIPAVLKVWASAYSARALAYRQRKQLANTSVSAAVVIQLMVQSAVSGVLFSRDPESGQRRCVICAGYGLGEGIVADRVSADTYRIAWDSTQPDREVVDKDTRIVLAADGGTRCVAVPAEMRNQPALDDGQILRLRDVAMRAETEFGVPQDIEWAFDAQGRLFLLQARSIVTTKRHATAGTTRIWDNSNIVESYPGITLPLTFSFARWCYETTFSPYMKQRALDYTPFRSPLRKHRHIFRNMIGLLDGQVYYNLLTWYRMMSFLPGFDRVRASWDRMIGISQSIDFESHRSNAFQALLAWAWCLWQLLAVRRNVRKFSVCFDSVYSRFSTADFNDFSADELIEIYQTLVYELGGKWSLTLDNDFAAMAYYEGLRWACGRWLPFAAPNLANDLMCGEHGMESVGPVRSLANIAKIVRDEPRFVELLAVQDDRNVWKAIHLDPKYAVLRGALDAHLKIYGDRGIEELKLERPSFREQPDDLIALIRDQLRVDVSGFVNGDRERAIRASAERYVLAHLGNPLKRALFRFLLHRARFAITSRENMRFARSRLFGIVRRIFRQMGLRFAEQGLIRCGEDIHYLTVDEIFSFVQGTSVTRNLAGLVDLRKTDYAEFSRRSPGERIRTSGIPYLNDLNDTPLQSDGGDAATGTACSCGIAQATARVVLDARQPFAAGEHILVARSTDPGWVFLMTRAKGIVVEKGSVLSHTAIIGRELGIPTIVGVKDATKRIPDGAQIRMDGSTGRIQWQSTNSPSITN